MSEPSSSKDTPKPGILRLDIDKDKPRRSSGGSVEFRKQPELQREVSVHNCNNALKSCKVYVGVFLRYKLKSSLWLLMELRIFLYDSQLLYVPLNAFILISGCTHQLAFNCI